MVTPLILAVLVAATPPATSTPQLLYEQAQAAYWREDNVAALEKLTGLLEAHPDSPESQWGRYLLKIILADKLKPQELSAILEQGKEQHPWLAALAAVRRQLTSGIGCIDDAQAVVAAYVAGADLASAKKLTEQLIAAHPDNAMLYKFLVDVWSDSATPEVAFGIVFRALRVIPEGGYQRDLQRQLEIMCKRHLAKPDPAASSNMVEKVIAAFPKEVKLYRSLSQTWEQAGRGEAALALLRRGIQAVPGPEQAGLRLTAVELAKRQWRYAEAIALLEQTPQPQPPEISEQIHLLRFAFGDRYLPVAALPFKSGSRAVGCRKDGTFLIVEKEHNQYQVRVVSAVGENLRVTRLSEEKGLRHSPEQSFGVFPDGTFLFRNRRLTDDGQEVQRLDLPADPWYAAVNEAGEVAMVTPFLYVADLTGKCVLRDTRPDGMLGGSLTGLGFSAQNIYVVKGDAVMVLTRSGEVTGKLALPEAQRIRHLVTDKKGFVYVLVSNRICVFDTESRRVHELPCPPEFQALIVDDQGALYLFGTKQTLKLAPQQGGIWALADKNGSQPQFKFPVKNDATK